eukprot:UN17730
MLDKMKIPKESLDVFNVIMKSKEAKHEYYHIVPGFFNLIHHLIETKREFKIIFRTFGIDLPIVQTEFNSFVSGKHPLSKKKTFEKLHLTEMGGLFRSDKDTIYISGAGHNLDGSTTLDSMRKMGKNEISGMKDVYKFFIDGNETP